MKSGWKDGSETLRVTVTKTKDCWTETKRTMLRSFKKKNRFRETKKKLCPTGGNTHKTSKTL